MRLCVDFGGTNIKLGVANTGALGSTVEFPVTGTPADLDAIVTAAGALGVRRGDVGSVAMAVPGLIDPAGTRLVLAHGKYDWMMHADLVAWAKSTFDADGAVENDARAALIGELASGCATGETDAAILVLGTGIGVAATLDGEPLRGPTGASGNLGGHITIDWNGPVCNCGNIGCAEVFGGSWALADRVRDVLETRGDVGFGGIPGGASGENWGAAATWWRNRLADGAIGFADVFRRAREHDPVAAVVRERALLSWATVGVTICHVLAPSAIVLAGGVARAAAEVVPVLASYIDAHIWRALPRPRILVAAEPSTSVLRGLAALQCQTNQPD